MKLKRSVRIALFQKLLNYTNQIYILFVLNFQGINKFKCVSGVFDTLIFRENFVL